MDDSLYLLMDDFLDPLFRGGHWALREPALCTALPFLPNLARQTVLEFASELVWCDERPPAPWSAWIENGHAWFSDGQSKERIRCPAGVRELVVMHNRIVLSVGKGRGGHVDLYDHRVAGPPWRCETRPHRHNGILDWKVSGNLLATDFQHATDCQHYCAVIHQRQFGPRHSLCYTVMDTHGSLADLGVEALLLLPERRMHIIAQLCQQALSLCLRSAASCRPVKVAIPSVIAAPSSADEMVTPVVQECEHAEPAAAPDASDAGVADQLWAQGVEHLISAEWAANRDSWLEEEASSTQARCGEWVDLIRLTRCERRVHEALHGGRELEAVRAATEDARQSCRHSSGASIFLHPDDRESVLRAVREETPRPHHILANRAFLPFIQEALRRLPCKKSVRVRSASPVALVRAAEEIYMVERTFLNARPRRLRLPADAVNVRRVLPASSSSGS